MGKFEEFAAEGGDAGFFGDGHDMIDVVDSMGIVDGLRWDVERKRNEKQDGEGRKTIFRKKADVARGSVFWGPA